MSRYPVYKNCKMVQPTAQSWKAREPPLPTQFVPTNYKAADLRFKRFLDDILASRNQGNLTWLENLTLSYAKNCNYYYQFQL